MNIDPKNDLTSYIIDSAIIMHAVKNPSLHYEIRRRILSQRVKNLQLQIKQFGGSLEDDGRKTTKISSKELIHELNNCAWEALDVKPYRDLHYGANQMPVRRVSKSVEKYMNTLRNQSRKVFATTHKYLYRCTNRRGVTVLESGRGLNPKEVRERQYLLTSLFSKPKIREHKELRFAIPPKKDITFIVPMSGRIDNVVRFIRNWKQIYDADRKLKLVVSLSANKTEYDVVTNLFSREFASKRFRNVTKIVNCTEPFARAKCIQVGIDTIELDELFFICDLDLLVKKDTLDRIRFLTKPLSVYFPVFFSQYQLSSEWNCKETNGFWRTFSYGMLAMTKFDYEKTAKFDMSISGWGGEDVKFFENCIQSKLVISRAKEIGLFHPWHPKYCTDLLSSKQHEDCVNTKMTHKASTIYLSRTFYNTST